MLNPPNKLWTSDEIRRFKILWDADWTASAIAHSLGRSRSAVCGQARRLNLRRRGSPIPGLRDIRFEAQQRRGMEIERSLIAAREELARAA